MIPKIYISSDLNLFSSMPIRLSIWFILVRIIIFVCSCDNRENFVYMLML
jgi:hypothetical protein